MQSKHRYYAFLLRLWQEGQNDSLIWRASLEEPATRRMIGFEGLEALTEHLNRLLDTPGGAEPPSHRNGGNFPRMHLNGGTDEGS